MIPDFHQYSAVQSRATAVPSVDLHTSWQILVCFVVQIDLFHFASIAYTPGFVIRLGLFPFPVESLSSPYRVLLASYQSNSIVNVIFVENSPETGSGRSGTAAVPATGRRSRWGRTNLAQPAGATVI